MIGMSKCEHDWNYTKLMCRKCDALAKHNGKKYVVIECTNCKKDAKVYVDKRFWCEECRPD